MTTDTWLPAVMFSSPPPSACFLSVLLDTTKLLSLQPCSGLSLSLCLFLYMSSRLDDVFGLSHTLEDKGIIRLSALYADGISSDYPPHQHFELVGPSLLYSFSHVFFFFLVSRRLALFLSIFFLRFSIMETVSNFLVNQVKNGKLFYFPAKNWFR